MEMPSNYFKKGGRTLKDKRFMWNDQLKISPNAGEPTGIKVSIVHKADDQFPFLHDTMVTCAAGKLLMAWYNCSEAEIVGRTIIRGCWSEDFGETWSSPEIIAEDTSGSGLHYVPVTFQEYAGKVYAYVTAMKSHDRPVGLECRVYENKIWRKVHEYQEPLLLNTLVRKLPNKMLAAAGRMASKAGELPLLPVVAFSEDKAPADWRIRVLPGPWQEPQQQGEFYEPFPETTLFTQDDSLTAIVRGEKNPMVYFSQDYGNSWMGPYDPELPVAAAKMEAGVLSNGTKYFIFNQRTDSNDRSRLVMAVWPPEQDSFTRFYVLRDGYDKQLQTGPYWHYPCACEQEGILYISCTASSDAENVRDGVLIRIPIENL